MKKYISTLLLATGVFLTGCKTQPDDINKPSTSLISESVSPENFDGLDQWRNCENGIDHNIVTPASGTVSLTTYSLGQKDGDKIAGGSVVDDRTRYPWMVHLNIFTTDGKFNYKGRCGGTLIADQWVLTAAHCIDIQHIENDINKTRSPKIKLDFVSVEVGINHLEEAQMKRYKSTSTLCHSTYDTDSLEDDIALIRLDKPLDIVSNPDLDGVKHARLPRQGSDGLDPANLPFTLATGWGRTASADRSPTLMEVELGIVEDQINTKAFRTEKKDVVGSVCMGDSGGPTHINYSTETKGTGTVIGITSFVRTRRANNCNFTDVTGTFTRVANYRQNIDDAILHCTSSDTCF